jgi:hypothetical protein
MLRRAVGNVKEIDRIFSLLVWRCDDLLNAQVTLALRSSYALAAEYNQQIGL